MGSPGPASSKSTSAALAVLLVGWIIANLIRRILTKALTRVRFEQLIERSGLKTPLSRVGVKDPSRLMATLIYWAAMLLVLQLAIDTFGESAIQDALDDLVGFLHTRPWDTAAPINERGMTVTLGTPEPAQYPVRLSSVKMAAASSTPDMRSDQ